MLSRQFVFFAFIGSLGFAGETTYDGTPRGRVEAPAGHQGELKVQTTGPSTKREESSGKNSFEKWKEYFQGAQSSYQSLAPETEPPGIESFLVSQGEGKFSVAILEQKCASPTKTDIPITLFVFSKEGETFFNITPGAIADKSEAGLKTAVDTAWNEAKKEAAIGADGGAYFRNYDTVPANAEYPITQHLIQPKLENGKITDIATSQLRKHTSGSGHREMFCKTTNKISLKTPEQILAEEKAARLAKAHAAFKQCQVCHTGGSAFQVDSKGVPSFSLAGGKTLTPEDVLSILNDEKHTNSETTQYFPMGIEEIRKAISDWVKDSSNP